MSSIDTRAYFSLREQFLQLDSGQYKEKYVKVIAVAYAR